jgi:hypothetical protein
MEISGQPTQSALHRAARSWDLVLVRNQDVRVEGRDVPRDKVAVMTDDNNKVFRVGSSSGSHCVLDE